MNETKRNVRNDLVVALGPGLDRVVKVDPELERGVEFLLIEFSQKLEGGAGAHPGKSCHHRIVNLANVMPLLLFPGASADTNDDGFYTETLHVIEWFFSAHEKHPFDLLM